MQVFFLCYFGLVFFFPFNSLKGWFWDILQFFSKTMFSWHAHIKILDGFVQFSSPF